MNKILCFCYGTEGEMLYSSSVTDKLYKYIYIYVMYLTGFSKDANIQSAFFYKVRVFRCDQVAVGSYVKETR